VTAPATTFDVAAIRGQLPATGEVTYLDFGTEGIVAEPVLRGYLEVLSRFERFGRRERTNALRTISGRRGA